MLTTQDWDTIHQSQVWGVWPNEAFVRFVKNRFKSKAKFLEIGCGAGAQVRFLVEEGHRVTGVDASAMAIQRAKKFLPVSHGQLTLKVADIRGFKPEEKVDCIVDICTLQHLELDDCRKVLEAAKGWLNPGGVLFSKMLWYVGGTCLPEVRDARSLSSDGKDFEVLLDGAVFDGWQTNQNTDAQYYLGGFIEHLVIEATL